MGLFGKSRKKKKIMKMKNQPVGAKWRSDISNIVLQ